MLRRIARLHGLEDGNPRGQGGRLDGRRREDLMPADRLVRLGDQRQRARAVFHEVMERRQGDVASGHENQPHV